ncbi:MAG: acyl-CoA/acyl-ACP dehydrogenase, partial [Burkholderiaceae bacterium]|nr:acyl-CoA/acyl-ACP dehydrogenase [Burkholderiaceae bacterium]
MDFDFSNEQKQLREQARRFLAEQCDRDAVRAVLDGPQPYDRALWRGLGELGYLGATIPEAFGGIGAGYLEACVLAEELGRVVAPVPFSSSIALAAECLMLAGTPAQKQRWLPLLASGKAIGTLAVTERPGRMTPGAILTSAADRGGDLVLDGVKLPVADGDIADFAVVLARDAGSAGDEARASLYLVELDAAGVG